MYDSIHDLRSQTSHYALDRDEHIAKAKKSLDEVMTPARLSRASLADCQRRVEELQSGLAKLRAENEKSERFYMHSVLMKPLIYLPERDRLRALRETLASRRRTLSAAKLQTTSTSNLHATIVSPPPSKEAIALSSLSGTIARARSGLVQELVEVFNVVEVGGRPPIGGKAGTKGEWTIGDLILPVPGDMRRTFLPATS